MKTKNLVMALVAAGVLGAAGYGLYTLGMRHGADMPATPSNPSGMASPQAATPAVAAPANESGEDATRRHIAAGLKAGDVDPAHGDRKSTRLNSSHLVISYAVFCLKKKTTKHEMACRCTRLIRI